MSAPRTAAGRALLERCGLFIEAEAAATERARIAGLPQFAEHRRCGPKYEGCYSHLPMTHCRACGMALPCDVMQLLAAIEGESK